MAIGPIVSPASWANGTVAAPIWFQNVQDNINAPGGITFASLQIDGIGGGAAVSIGGGHVRFLGGTPTVITGNANGYLASGVGATGSITGGGSDTRGVLNVTTGTGPAGGNASLCQVVFGNPWTTFFPQIVLLTPANLPAAAITSAQQIYITGLGATNWQTLGGSSALAASTTYSWNYLVLG